MYEVFSEFEKAPDREAKKNVLRRHYTTSLEYVLKGAFHPDVHWAIKKVPYYKPSDDPPGLSNLNMAGVIRRFYLFQEGNPNTPNMSDEKRNKLLSDILEDMEAKEATVLINMMLKKLRVKGLDYKIVQETFPGLLP